ncbi:MAG TPA: hypothetical protein DCR48_03875 [Flavobacteriales bacterium]|nr:hypothetical protein [Flavobacteriales bacterium]
MSQILLIVPRQYGYELTIRKNLELLGNEVYTLYHPSTKSLMYWILAKLSRGLFLSWRSKEEKKILSLLKTSRFDVVYAIHGYQYSPNFYYKLRLNGVQKIFAYTWDSIRETEFGRNINDYLTIFDRIYSFDPADAVNYRLNYLPLFYSEEGTADVPEQDYFLFVGSLVTMKRYEYFIKIKDYCLRNNVEFRYHLRVSYRLFFRELLKFNLLRHVSFKNLEYRDYLSLTKRAKGVFDLPGQEQLGLTMRSIEVLALKKLLITFNPTIKTLDIDPRSYLLIDADNICINFDVNFEPSDISPLHIKEWLRIQLEDV